MALGERDERAQAGTVDEVDLAQVENAAMGSLKFCRDLYNVTIQSIHAIYVEMIVKVWERLFQIPVDCHPCFAIDGLRDGSTELIIIAEKELCLLEIRALDGIQQGLYDFSRIHDIFLYFWLNCLKANGPGSEWTFPLEHPPFPPNDKRLVYL